MASIGYLGPPGTFTQEALRLKFGAEYGPEVSYPTVVDVLLAVDRGEVDCGIVPIENSIEGTVNATVDTLAFDTELLIEREAVLRVRLSLVANKGVMLGEITEVISHPHATAQCRRYLAERLSDIKITAANSTAEAAMLVAESSRPVAAIASEFAANMYGLDVIEKDIEDHHGNMTRFIVVGRNQTSRTGRDKTSVVCFIRENRPGSLLEILSEFASRSINLTKIESRPTKKALGEYYFFIDMEGHVEDPPVAEALSRLKFILRKLKFLGSYPRAQVEIED